MKLFYFKAVFLVCFIFSSSVKSQEISPYLVGTNAWYTNPSQQVWDLTAESGVQTIRIGGHAFDDNMPSKASLLSWVKKIQAMGAEPIIQVSQYQSAAVAADLVQYFNVEKSGEIAPIKFWNIGNEPWLQNGRPSTSVVGAMVEAYFKPIAAAMKEVDPTIKIYGPDFCYYIEPAINDLFGGKNDIAGKVPDKDYYYCDGISWHRYPQEDNINLAYAGIDDFKGAIIKCKQKVDAVNAAKNRTGDDALGWGIGEYNAKGGAVVHTWGNGQMFGGILGLCMEYGATYATSWSMFENGGNRQGTDFSFIDGANMTPRASYRHMEFVAKYFKGEYVDGTANNNGFFVYGAQNEEQTSVMIMHRAEGNPKEYTFFLNDTATSEETYVINFEAGKEIQYSDIITPRTTHVFIFRGDSIIKIEYSSDDFDNEIPPHYSVVSAADELPEKPTGFITTPVSHSEIELSWTDNSDNETGFIIEREGTGGFEIIKILSPDSTSYTDSDLMPETSYSYRVRTYNSVGKSDYSDVSSASTLESPPPTAYNGPHAIPGKIQAEDFNDNVAGIGFFDSDNENEGSAYRSTGVDIENSTDTGGGYNIGYIETGEWLSYLIENVTPGTYDLAFRTASNVSTGTKRIDVFIDDVKVGEVTPKYTGGWQNWETLILENIEIENADPIILTLKFTGQEYNINWFEFGENLGTSVSNDFLDRKLKVFYSNRTKNISLSSNRIIKNAVVNIININGQSYYKSSFDNLKTAEINASGWAKGIYFVSVSNQNERLSYKLIVD